jgi:hypothetical protein
MSVHNKKIRDTQFYKDNLHKKVTGKQINQITNNETLYKCLSKKFTRNDFTYKMGLNINVDFGVDNNYKNIFDFVNKHSIIYDLDPEYIFPANAKIPNDSICYIANARIPDDSICYLDDYDIICDIIIIESIKLIKEHELMKNYDFCSDAIEKEPWIICSVNDELLLNNVNLWSKAVDSFDTSFENEHNDETFIEYISKEVLKNNIDLCMAAIKRDCDCIEYIDDDILKNNVELCTEAVKQNGNTIRYINKKILNNNMHLYMEAIKRHGNAIQYIDKEILNNNINLYVEAVKQNGSIIQSIDKKILNNNINLYVEAVKQCGLNIMFISKKILNNNVNLCVDAVKQNYEAIKYINKDILLKNKIICKIYFLDVK